MFVSLECSRTCYLGRNGDAADADKTDHNACRRYNLDVINAARERPGSSRGGWNGKRDSAGGSAHGDVATAHAGIAGGHAFDGLWNLHARRVAGKIDGDASRVDVSERVTVCRAFFDLDADLVAFFNGRRCRPCDFSALALTFGLIAMSACIFTCSKLKNAAKCLAARCQFGVFLLSREDAREQHHSISG